MKRVFLLIIVTWSVLTSDAQTFESEYLFFNYLYSNGLHNESLTLLYELGDYGQLSKGQQDTINYFTGKILYEQKQLGLSAEYFNEVGTSNQVFWNEARMFGSLNNIYLRKFEVANNFLQVEFQDAKFNAIKNYELAGIALLQRNHEQFETLAHDFTNDYFEIQSQQENLLKIQQEVIQFKPKSPFLAGLFSAIIPGTGKMYAGKFGQGFASLLSTGLFGLQTWEGYRKDGPGSARFIIFGSLFTAFYVANIWGSVLSVNVRRNEFNDTIDEAIMVDLHIPLRTVFN